MACIPLKTQAETVYSPYSRHKVLLKELPIFSCSACFRAISGRELDTEIFPDRSMECVYTGEAQPNWQAIVEEYSDSSADMRLEMLPLHHTR